MVAKAKATSENVDKRDIIRHLQVKKKNHQESEIRLGVDTNNFK